MCRVQGLAPLLFKYRSSKAAKRGFDRSFNNWDASACKWTAKDIESKQLKKVQYSSFGVLWQQHLAIASWVQGVTMVIGMAHRVFMKIMPTNYAIDTEKELVKPFCRKHGTMPQFVGGDPFKKSSDGTINK